MKKSIYIGISMSPHDPSIAIVDSNGKIQFAEATERYLQNKRAWNCIPDNINYIDKLLQKYCSNCDEVVTALTWSKKHLSLLPIAAKSTFYLKKLKPFFINLINGLRINGIMVSENLRFRLNEIFPETKYVKRMYEHHLTHAANACFGSPFKEAVCFITDGYGELASTKAYLYEHGYIKELKSIKPSRGFFSLGSLYAYICWVCGFDPLKGEEWKVMGLAPYGKFDKDIYISLKEILQVKKTQITYGSHHKEAIKKTFGMRRDLKDSPLKSADFAFTGQKFFCDILEEVLNNLYAEVPINNLIIGGGCALNSAWNGKILAKTPFENLHVPSAPGDDGNSIGAALLAFYEDHPDVKPDYELLTPYIGSTIKENCIKRIGRLGKLKNHLKPNEDICVKTAELLAKGKIVGWVQGRAEFGPRALGNRSILADPRKSTIKDEINSKVKFREEFRPFAPSILHEYGSEYFKNYQETPYMERALAFKEDVIDKVPGVVHVDGTGRLQSVKKELNEKYYQLIQTFYELTGVPILLNTSFNVMGKPIIHSAEDAISVFFTTGLDALVIEEQLFIK